MLTWAIAWAVVKGDANDAYLFPSMLVDFLLVIFTVLAIAELVAK